MYYIYSYVNNNKPYYIGKGKGRRAYTQQNHYVPVPETDNIHIISHFDNNTSALIREWEMISLLQLKSEGGMLDNKVKGCCPPDRTGTTFTLTEEQKQKLRKPKNYARTAEHSEKIAVQNRGKKHTEQHKRKISEGCKGKTGTPGNSFRAKSYLVTFPNGSVEEVYNMANFCKEHNLTRSAMCLVAKGKANHHKGFITKYL